MPRSAAIAMVFAWAATATSALAAHPVEDKAKPPIEVLERDIAGNATKVRIGGRVVDVCTPEKQDSCINPRDAGLDQGTREINYWPGRPASEIEGPLSVEEPAEVPAREEAPSGEPEQR